MTTLAITPNWKNKSAKFKGTVAAGEHVSVTIQNENGEGGEFIDDASTLRLRVVNPCNGRTLAIFPEPVPEGETPETWDTDLSPLRCTLNLNTVQMLRAVPPAANVSLLFVLDDYDNKTLYFKEQFPVEHWPRLRGEEEPIDLDNYKDIIAEFNTRLTAAEQTVADAAANAQSAANSASAAADSAATAATAATDAQAGAIASKNAAQTAANDAASAKTAAEDAQDAAEDAQEAAETAQGKAQEYAEAAAESAAAFVVDDTLSVEGAAADAKAVGEANQSLAAQISTVQGGLNSEVTARETLAAAVGDNRQNLAAEIARAQGAEQGLENRKADKATTYTKTEVDSKIAAVQTFGKVVVQTLPDIADADDKTIYLVPRADSEAPDLCDEYVVVEESGVRRWERIGAKAVDLTLDDTVTSASANGVKSSGIWSAIWGALAALPAGFSSLYDWCVAQLAGKLDKSGGTATGQITVTHNDVPPLRIEEQGFKAVYDRSGVAGSQTVYAPGVIRNGDNNLILPTASGTFALLSDIYAAVQQIAPAWVSGTTYAANAIVTYNGEIYCNTGGGTFMSDIPPSADTNWEAKPVSELFLPVLGGEKIDDLAISEGGIKLYGNSSGYWAIYKDAQGIYLYNGTDAYLLVPDDGTRTGGGIFALAAPNPTAGHLAALDANGNPVDSGIAAGDLLTIVNLSDSTETMASILARLDAINTAHKHVFFDCSGIDVNPRLYLCTIMIDADANAVRVYDQVTGKLYVGPYNATETIGEVFAKAVDAYYPIVVTAATLDGATVTGQTVTLREGADASAPVYDTAAYNGSPVTFVVHKGFQYFVEITPGLAGHFSPSTATGVVNAPVSVTLTYQDTSNITDYIGLKGFLDTVAADPTLTTDAERIAFAQAALIPAAGGAKEIPDTFTNTAGTVYDNPMVVYAIDYVKGADGQMHLAALVQRKWCSSYDVQFDAPEGVECDSETETTAEDGISYYGLALGATSKTAANLTLLELSTGDALPHADYEAIYKSAIRDTTRNSLQYGYNNWRDSAYRQHLNSSAAPGAWWSPTHVGDTAPSNPNSVRGYMAGCSAALIAAAKPVYVKTWPNHITDGANTLDTVYETLDTFFLPSGVEVYANVNMDGASPVEGPLSEYWKIRMGLENPSTAAASTRIMYRELPVGSTANRSAASVRLRSANRGYSNHVWYVNTSGQVNTTNASTAYASVPACAIY